jgi:hypothetical protein
MAGILRVDGTDRAVASVATIGGAVCFAAAADLMAADEGFGAGRA